MQVTGTGHQQTKDRTPQRNNRISYVRNIGAQDYIIRVRVWTDKTNSGLYNATLDRWNRQRSKQSTIVKDYGLKDIKKEGFQFIR